MLSLLCVADTHGFLASEQLEGHGQPDALVLLGDLQTSINPVLARFPHLPAFGIAGNHDPDDVFSTLPVTDLHGRVVTWNGIAIAGLAGCLRYKASVSSWLFWEREYALLLAQMPPADLVISHCAPHSCWREYPPGVDAEYHHPHAGSQALRDYVLQTKPKLLVHGHLHKPGSTVLGATWVQCIYGAELVKLDLTQPHSTAD